MRARAHLRDELLDDILDQVGPVVADANIVLEVKKSFNRALNK